MFSLKEMRDAFRMGTLRHQAEPNLRKIVIARKEQTASYSDILNLHTADNVDMNAPDGTIPWMMDFDPLP